jgi:hypothetical protein
MKRKESDIPTNNGSSQNHDEPPTVEPKLFYYDGFWTLEQAKKICSLWMCHIDDDPDYYWLPFTSMTPERNLRRYRPIVPLNLTHNPRSAAGSYGFVLPILVLVNETDNLYV